METGINLITAYRNARAKGAPSSAYQGVTQPAWRGESYASPHDGRGAAVWALHKAREALAEHKAAKAAFAAVSAPYGDPEHKAALKRASRARARVTFYGGQDYGAGTWQGGAGHMDTRRERGALFFAHDDTAQGALRNIWDAHALARLDHTGWFTDPFGEVFRDGTGLCVGVVGQMRGRDGRACFVPGYRFGGHDDSGTFDMRNRFYAEGREEYHAEDAAAECARTADSMAEHAAEAEREYQTAWTLGSRDADAADEIEAAREELRDILRERREVRDAEGERPALCGAIRARVATLWGEVQRLRRERESLREGEGLGLSVYMGEAEREAFREAGGERAT